MKLADFPLLEPEVHIVRAESGAPLLQWDRYSEVRVWFDDDGLLWLAHGDDLVELEAGSGGKLFATLVLRPGLVWLLLRQTGRDFQLQTILPSDSLPLNEAAQVSVDEQTINSLVRQGALQTADAGAALEWLRDEFIVEGPRPWMAILRVPQAGPGDWKLLGRLWRLDLQATPSGRVLIRRAERLTSRRVEWTMLTGVLEFVEGTVASQLLSATAQATFDQSVKSYGSYLDLWRKYSEQEWERSLRQAASVGVLAYSKAEEASDEGEVWRFQVVPAELQSFMDAWKALESDLDLELEASARHPDWTTNIEDATRSITSARRFRGRPLTLRNKPGQLMIESRQRPPEQGYLSLSLAGDRTVQERRLKARAAIESGRRMPQLRFLLQDLPLPLLRGETHRALSRHARECFKHGDPTPRQEKAIKVALETPDIALIIGPPGTGKTQVIAALERRISEMGEQQNAQHQVLISSFQHDAVENALERTSVFGLPGVKVGHRKQADAIDLVERWCAQTRSKVEDKVTRHEAEQPHLASLNRLHLSIAKLRHGQLAPAERQTEIDKLSASIAELAELRPGVRLSPVLLDEWKDYVAEQPVMPTRSVSDSKLLLGKVRGLRVTPTAFADDGQDRLSDLLSTIEWLGGGPEDLVAQLRSLQTVSLLDTDTAECLSALKNALLDTLLDYRPPVVKNRLDERGRSLLIAIETAITDRLKASRMGVAGVLARYRDAFKLEPERANDTVREYAMVIGATCQQADSERMADLKNLNGLGDAGISFNTVVVDEAARANPLDLFIPMSMAERRVVLVGDHRQLPHLLEPAVEEAVAEAHDLSDEQRKAYEESLFQRLWRQLKEREKRDGIPRVVMLDIQFRMHPVLGDFVSREFYEKEKLDPVKSGRPASSFLSDIPGHAKRVCCWIDVPWSNGDGSESRQGVPSWHRKSEARAVAAEAKRLLEACGDSVSIGVITFYSAQRDAIFRELKQFGLVDRDTETGEWLIADEYRKTNKGEERFRVGTVDAFQGKEFDIVLLSVVRSNRKGLPQGEAGDEAFEKAANGKYGHLRLSNRMNVAMSRQRSLLIAVGDRAMAEGIGATKAVPALNAFLQLCQGAHGHVC